jgi:Outer membrane protein beta-barrel domain
MKSNVFLCFFLVVSCASASFAQSTPAFEASLGYSFLRESSNFNRHGWIASAAGNVNHWFGVKGEIGGSYSDSLNSDIHSFLAGPQFTARGRETITPWAHFLLGVTRNQRVFPVLFVPAPSTILLNATDSNFAIQPGGGVDYWLQPKFGIRAGADYRRSILNNGRSDINYGQLHVGIVFRFGGE